MLVEKYKDKGLIYLCEKTKEGRATNFANTYILAINNKAFIIDTSCKKDRLKEIKAILKNYSAYVILCSHYHNDHIANNGRLASKKSPIIYHENAASKVRYLRTNSTGQMLEMFAQMDKKDFLLRIGFFGKKLPHILTKRKIYSDYIAKSILFITSYLYSVINIGIIYSGKKYITYLKDKEQRPLHLKVKNKMGWELDDNLFAISTPGHTDCHLCFYDKKNKIFFAGDSLNFLNPNDIQFGNIRESALSRKKILDIVKAEKIKILCQGHYPPIEGTENIIRYITAVIENHNKVYNLIKTEAKRQKTLPFKELYKKIYSIKDPLIQKLKKITFPRSTLVFLDVYLLKILQEEDL